MPNGAAFDDAVKIASENPGLGVGIHISLVGEKAVAPARAVGGLCDPGGMLPASYGAFTKGYLLRRFGPREVRAEIEAQVRRALQTGLKFTHIDSHQHLHVLPGVLTSVLDMAASSGIPVVRVPYERGGANPQGLSPRGMQMWVLSMLARRCAAQARRAGLRSASSFWGLGVSGAMDESNLLSTLQRLRPGVNEIMCHPGLLDPETAGRYDWGYRWEDEATALTSKAVLRLVESEGIRLASFRDAWD